MSTETTSISGFSMGRVYSRNRHISDLSPDFKNLLHICCVCSRKQLQVLFSNISQFEFGGNRVGPGSANYVECMQLHGHLI
jgi:hypothetical protein